MRFRRVLTGDPAADGEPLTSKLKPEASMEAVKARLGQVAPEKMEWFEIQTQQSRAASMVLSNRHAMCSSATMAVPKGLGWWQIIGRQTHRWSYSSRNSNESIFESISCMLS